MHIRQCGFYLERNILFIIKEAARLIRNIEQIVEAVIKKEPKTIAVAAAQDLDVLLAISKAIENKIANAILVGDKEKIIKIGKENNIPVHNFEIIDIIDISEASNKAVELVSTGKAHILMKGLVDTSIYLKAILNPEIGLRTENILSSVCVTQVSGFDRLMLITDPGFNIEPDITMKKRIIKNAVQVAHALENDEPKVAVICAKEKVNPKMQATVDASKLEEMNKKGEIKGCVVGGPFALDNAVSEKAAAHKGINHPVAGRADILLAPNIETGNVLYKSAVYFANSSNAAVVVGAKAPIVLTSRTDSDETKFNSIALAALLSDTNQN